MTDASALRNISTDQLQELVRKHRDGDIAIRIVSKTPFENEPTHDAITWLDGWLPRIVGEIEQEIRRRLI